MNTRWPGPRRTVSTRENVEKVRQAMLSSPSCSARRHATELRFNDQTVRRILHKDLRLHPYKMAIVQELNVRDYAQKAAFTENMIAIFEDNNNAIIMMSDEAHCQLNCVVNKQNYQYWALENPCNLHERPLHSPKVTVWSAISKSGIIGPHFIKKNGITVKVKSYRNINMSRIKMYVLEQKVALPLLKTPPPLFFLINILISTFLIFISCYLLSASYQLFIISYQYSYQRYHVLHILSLITPITQQPY